MKTAVIFYSYDGNCAFVAEQLKAQLNADILRLETVDRKRRTGFAKYFWGGSQVVMGRKPPIKPFTFSSEAYDLIVLGVPVWAGSPAPAMRTFLSKTRISGKKIALFVCHGGGKGKALDKFRAMLTGNTIVSEIDFVDPAGNNPQEQKKRIEDWAKAISG